MRRIRRLRILNTFPVLGVLEDTKSLELTGAEVAILTFVYFFSAGSSHLGGRGIEDIPRVLHSMEVR